MKKVTQYVIIAVVLVCSVGLVSAGILLTLNQPNPDQKQWKYEYSFEDGLEGWTPDGTDLDDPPINWSIAPSDEQAFDGNSSLKLYLENFNDAGKIWVERIFDVKASSSYHVQVSFTFGTFDFGDFNLFNIITSVLNHELTNRDELMYQGDTGHHSEEEGLVWLEKTYDFYIDTDENGELYINLGVWGSWETTRTYFIDDVVITITEQEPIAEYPTLTGGWTLQHYNWEGNLTKEENVTITQDNGSVTFSYDKGLFTCTGQIIQASDDHSEHDTEFVIVGCDVRGIGVNVIYLRSEQELITETPLCETCNPSVFIRQ